MTRPKLKVGDPVVVRNLYEQVYLKTRSFKLGDKGIVIKILGDVITLDVDGEHKKINIYNVKKQRPYVKRKK